MNSLVLLSKLWRFELAGCLTTLIIPALDAGIFFVANKKHTRVKPAYDESGE